MEQAQAAVKARDHGRALELYNQVIAPHAAAFWDLTRCCNGLHKQSASPTTP